MKPIRFLIAVLATIGLAACYTSETPLVSDNDAATPFEKITFKGQGADDKPVTFTRDGKAFLSVSEDGSKIWLRLKSVEGDYFVAQLSGEDNSSDSIQILYAYMRLDIPNKVAETYKSIGTKDDVRPGLRECKDGICIDDLDAYIAYAKEGIATGGTPDQKFEIVVE